MKNKSKTFLFSLGLVNLKLIAAHQLQRKRLDWLVRVPMYNRLLPTRKPRQISLFARDNSTRNNLMARPDRGRAEKQTRRRSRRDGSVISVYAATQQNQT